MSKKVELYSPASHNLSKSFRRNLENTIRRGFRPEEVALLKRNEKNKKDKPNE